MLIEDFAFCLCSQLSIVEVVFLSPNLFLGHKYLNIEMAGICAKCKPSSAYKKETVKSRTISLVTAARSGHNRCVENLIATGAQVNKAVEAGLTPLMAVFSW